MSTLSLFWRTAIVAAAIFGAVLLTIGVLAVLATIAARALDARRERQRERQADTEIDAIIATLDSDIAGLLGSPETGGQQ